MIDLYYSGGSGGNFLLHLILLSKQHICSFNGYPPSTDDNFNEIFADVFNTQWDILENWKDSEIIPDNVVVSSKIFTPISFTCLFCNIDKFVKVKPHILARSNTSISVYANPVLLDKLVRYKINTHNKHDAIAGVINKQIESRILIGKKLSDIVDHGFSLNEIVSTSGQNVCDALSIPYTQAHADFVARWTYMHPPHIRTLLLN